TREERGLVQWSSSGSSTSTETSSYNFPLGMDAVRRIHWLRWFPICPTFTGFKVSDEALPPAGEEQGGGEEEVGDVPLPSTKADRKSISMASLTSSEEFLPQLPPGLQHTWPGQMPQKSQELNRIARSPFSA
ncbi:hypothetical protein AMECASPLE_027653, partial [Ameca splendens]